MGSYSRCEKTDMENKHSGKDFKSSGSGRMLRRGLAAALGLLLAMTAESRDLLAPPGGLMRVEVQTCQLQCGRTLAECERARTPGARCPRNYQACREDCESGAAKPALDAATQRKTICVQRCETSASLCEQNNRQGEAHCSRGQSLCIARC